MEKLKEHKCFDGTVNFWKHNSELTQTEMKFSSFIPEGEVKAGLIWLSGLTCTEENFITKAGAQKYLAEQKIAVFCPDTSPRGLDLPAEHESYDFGSGAGFYVDATQPGYSEHYKMYSYILDEFYSLITQKFGIERVSIFGHSMGGHGALILGLNNPDKFKSVSAFSPIVNPMACQWGQKAFKGYVGEDESAWEKYDATKLIKAGKSHSKTLLIDQGLNDEFLEKQLLTKNLEEACEENNQKCEIRFREGYDHSYYFISTFIQSHIEFHKKALS